HFYIRNNQYVGSNTETLNIESKWVQIEEGNKATDWTPAPEDMASQAQLSVLNDNINMRVSKGELMSQINIEAGRTLIQSNKLYLDAQSVVFSGQAFIPGAVIENASIDGAKIANATIGSAKIANLDVNKISGNTSNFVRSAWNSINSRADMDANRLRFTHTDGSSTQIGVNGLVRVESGTTRPYQYRTYVGSATIVGKTYGDGVRITLPSDFKGKDFKVIIAYTGTGRQPGVTGNYELTSINLNQPKIRSSDGSFF